MMTVEAEVEIGARANRSWEHDQLAWGYHDETDRDGGGSEGARDGRSADERKRARIGYGGSARCRSFGIPRGPLVSGACIFFSCTMVDAHTLLGGGVCRCEHVLCIDRS